MCTVSLVTTVNVQHFTELKATQAILLLVMCLCIHISMGFVPSKLSLFHFAQCHTFLEYLIPYIVRRLKYSWDILTPVCYLSQYLHCIQ